MTLCVSVCTLLTLLSLVQSQMAIDRNCNILEARYYLGYTVKDSLQAMVLLFLNS